MWTSKDVVDNRGSDKIAHAKTGSRPSQNKCGSVRPWQCLQETERSSLGLPLLHLGGRSSVPAVEGWISRPRKFLIQCEGSITASHTHALRTRQPWRGRTVARPSPRRIPSDFWSPHVQPSGAPSELGICSKIEVGLTMLCRLRHAACGRRIARRTSPCGDTFPR